jgi:hypothetical protein
MTRGTDSLIAYAPFAVAGLLVGMGLSVLVGAYMLDRWGPGADAPGDDRARLTGTVAWAGWRASARGPERFLEIRLRDDPRRFLVAASDVPAAVYEQWGRADRLPRLEGQQASIVVAARFQERPRPSTPYILSLRVEGTTVVPDQRAAGSPSPWREPVVTVLLGTGLLVGLVLAGVSGHHLAICVRAWRRG